MTFESEEGYQRAKRYNEYIDPQSVELIKHDKEIRGEEYSNEFDYTHYEKILGEKIELEEASEPTDIIWENR